MTEIVTMTSGPLSLVIGLPTAGMPEIISFGLKAATGRIWRDDMRSSRVNGMDEAGPSAVLLPTGGLGYFGWPAISGHRDGRDFVLQFRDWKARHDGSTTTLHAVDPVAAIEIAINICMSNSGVLSMSTFLTNRGAEYTVDRCMAASFLLPQGEATLNYFTGMWGREFQSRSCRVDHSLWLQENRRGRTSHDKPPLISIEVGTQNLLFHLGWSGNHVIAVDVLDDGRRLVHLGELFEPGEIRLKRGATYSSPVAYACSDDACFHAFVRDELLLWPKGIMKPRPVMLNTWEGNYFDHRLDSLKAQADAAAALGIERFVLDDGWFGKRDDDTTSLGDWTVDSRKYPDGLTPLADHVIGLGMEFGIWFEPEMVSPQSDLFRAHPEWVLQVDGRPLLLSRNQLVLDLSRPEVGEYLYGAISALLSKHAISYVKWDMNRDLTHVGGRDGTARTSAQTQAVYTLMHRIRSAFPHVEIESCASGGGRIDFGVLRYTHRVWTSDCTDALERLEIQRGASSLLPPEILGAHIAASPNHQTARRLSLSFRAIVALAYHLGVELDPVALSEDDRVELSRWIKLHKDLRPLLHAPDAQFRMAPEDGRYVWGAADNDRMAVFVAQGPQMVAEQPPPLRVPAPQHDDRSWRVKAIHPAEPDFIRVSDMQRRLLRGELSFSIPDLTELGLPLPMLRPESGLILELEPVAGVH